MSVLTMPSSRPSSETELEAITPAGGVAFWSTDTRARRRHCPGDRRGAAASRRRHAGGRLSVRRARRIGHGGAGLHLGRASAQRPAGTGAGSRSMAGRTPDQRRGGGRLAARGPSAGSDVRVGTGVTAGNVLPSRRAHVARRARVQRAGARWRPAVAPMAAGADRTPAARHPDPERGRAAPPSRERASCQCRRDRTAERPAAGGQRLPEGRDQELSRLRRHRRRKPLTAPGPDARRSSRTHQFHGAAPGRNRNRQGAVRPRPARAEPAARAPAGARQLRRAAADPGRKRVVRP